ncbi:MAG: 1-deoxy-D-xylulose-5-phosphate synthase [Bacteroidia bacterium]|nr:1-deoxy-D-xylulose-5-phosphate synthase [Bacteroidia bacterium]
MKKIYNDTRDAAFEELYDIALNDLRVIVLSADTGALMFKEFKKNIPDQFFNVGISEQNAISVAAGLALNGRHVFVFGISNFVTLRCFEQIRVDICCMGLPVTLLGMGTGYTYSSDGPTHHITEDIAAIRALPGMTIWSPSDYAMTAAVVHLAHKLKTPSYIRFDKGPFQHLYDDSDHDFKDGLAELQTGEDLTIVATGFMVGQALHIAEQLNAKGIKTGVVDFYRLKPVNSSKLVSIFRRTKRVVTLEEHMMAGGSGSIILEKMAENDIMLPVKVFGIPDTYRFEAGSRDMLQKLDGLDVDRLTVAITKWIN